VRANAAAAPTDDLLDRVTIYRAGMEPEAVQIIETELGRRNVSFEKIEAHGKTRRESAIMDGPVARRCSFCYKPAVHEGWGWHRLYSLVPLFPRRLYYCDNHRPR
jgi:hypothetical protein